MRSTVVGIELPSDFPLGPYDSAAQLVRKHAPSEAWREWAAGWNGVAYRFRAAAEYDETFTSSYRQHSATPAFHERFRQEAALFGFFVSALSTLECAAYAAFALGALANPAAFPMATPRDLRHINLRSTSGAFSKAFPTHVLTGEFAALRADRTLAEIEAMRNFLVHRAQPPRGFVQDIGASIPKPTSWGGLVLDETLTTSRRAWLAARLDRLLTAVEGFVAAHL